MYNSVSSNGYSKDRMTKYKYNGAVEIFIHNVGIVMPGATFESDELIDNPDFEKVEEQSKSKK